MSVIARITLELHDDGALSVQGNIGDKHTALQMLDAGRAAVEGQYAPRPELIVPARETGAPQPVWPLTP